MIEIKNYIYDRLITCETNDVIYNLYIPELVSRIYEGELGLKPIDYSIETSVVTTGDIMTKDGDSVAVALNKYVCVKSNWDRTLVLCSVESVDFDGVMPLEDIIKSKTGGSKWNIKKAISLSV